MGKRKKYPISSAIWVKNFVIFDRLAKE